MPTTATMARFAFAEAKNQLSALTANANKTGEPFVITKNNKPWVEVRPLAVQESRKGAVSITPIRREVEVADLDDIFKDYEGDYVAREDGFASAVGAEAM